MQFNIKTMAFLSAVSFSSLPAVRGLGLGLGLVGSALDLGNTLASNSGAGQPAADAIAFGQELQNKDQANHWVTWFEGRPACPGQQILGVLTKSLCGQTSVVGATTVVFEGCKASSDGGPTFITDLDGYQVGSCSRDKDKINCHGNDHDIVKHGVCTIAPPPQRKRSYVQW